ncbi:hypothetical protein C8J56DRAFT_891555 [Mycena floridula]|nr:hypothetical protein C8J56DRAFT_891555 [Mycena floridula]
MASLLTVTVSVDEAAGINEDVIDGNSTDIVTVSIEPVPLSIASAPLPMAKRASQFGWNLSKRIRRPLLHNELVVSGNVFAETESRRSSGVGCARDASGNVFDRATLTDLSLHYYDVLNEGVPMFQRARIVYKQPLGRPFLRKMNRPVKATRRIIEAPRWASRRSYEAHLWARLLGASDFVGTAIKVPNGDIHVTLAPWLRRPNFLNVCCEFLLQSPNQKWDLCIHPAYNPWCKWPFSPSSIPRYSGCSVVIPQGLLFASSLMDKEKKSKSYEFHGHVGSFVGTEQNCGQPHRRS